MADNHAGQLACEAMTLIAKALSQLEVGELSIANFGESIKILHPFEQPFSNQAGANVRFTRFFARVNQSL
jgi:midasin (ATPase involved in ribosome maturation)